MSNLPPLPQADFRGMEIDGVQPHWYTADQLLAFAEEAVRLEREACAKTVEMTPSQWGEHTRFAAAIRARSQEGQG